MMRYLWLLLPLPLWAEPTGASTPNMTSWLLSSLLVIGLIVVLGALLKKSRLSQSLNGGQMKVVATLPLGVKEKLMVVRVGEQQYLLGVTPAQVSFLSRLETPLDEIQPFAQQLGKLMKKDDHA
ncbi:flagellar biosynthetic protein FliO [Aeromonas schubertii]|uniref:Flagellar protein n=1 Tax=Aeromonas schubertii TaxID=652 RepID=A0ABS7VB78_9GAMM|nr:flagellar biosynthetic protein FliO [Aeromonas schubertii]MBZ6066149.1 flagellar biosynthetic protein FliO [Aeromonas schubertii]